MSDDRRDDTGYVLEFGRYSQEQDHLNSEITTNSRELKSNNGYHEEMSVDPELGDVLVDFIIDYLDFISESDTLNEQSLRLTSNELRVMSCVYKRFRHNQPCNLSYLIDRTGISRATVSRVLTTLFEYRLIREEVDNDDRRVRHLFPTEIGETSMGRVTAWLDSWAEKLNAIMGEKHKGSN